MAEQFYELLIVDRVGLGDILEETIVLLEFGKRVGGEELADLSLLDAVQ